MPNFSDLDITKGKIAFEEEETLERPELNPDMNQLWWSKESE